MKPAYRDEKPDRLAWPELPDWARDYARADWIKRQTIKQIHDPKIRRLVARALNLVRDGYDYPAECRKMRKGRTS